MTVHRFRFDPSYRLATLPVGVLEHAGASMTVEDPEALRADLAKQGR
jgi:hypothetical protein